MKINYFHVFLLSLFLTSCSSSEFEPTPDPKPTPVDTYELFGQLMLDEIFGTYYWWYDRTPSSVDWNSDFYDYFDKHLVAEDRWSWMTSGDEFRESQEGIATGSYGFSLGQAVDGYEVPDYRIYVKYVFPDTPMAEKGVCRGWRMDAIGGYNVEDLIRSEAGITILNEELDKDSNHFEFYDGTQTHSFDASRATVSTRSYLVRKIFTSEDYQALSRPVGYFNYYTFNDYLSDDLPETISMFKQAGVSDVILDLRYNGGGSTLALSKLVGLLSPERLDGKVFSVIEHNPNLSVLDEETYYDVDEESMNLERLYVITGSGTASASEVLINGLRDGLGAQNLILVGSTTYGKPNGMYAFAYPEGSDSDYYDEADYVYLPICFYTTNSSGQYIPDEGFVPDISVPDDIYHDWGSDEYLIRTCLELIAGVRTKSTPADMVRGRDILTGGCRITSAEDAGNYGRLIAPMPESISSTEEMRNEGSGPVE